MCVRRWWVVHMRMRGGLRVFLGRRRRPLRVQRLLLVRSACRIGLLLSRNQCGIDRRRTMLLFVDRRCFPSGCFSTRLHRCRVRHRGLCSLGRDWRQEGLRMRLSRCRRYLRWHRGRWPYSLGGSGCSGRMPRHERRDRLRAGGYRGHGMHDRRQCSRKMRARRHRCFEWPATGRCTGRCHHRHRARVVDVRDVGDVRRRVVRHVVDRRVLHPHADVGDRRCADDHCGRRADGRRHDQAEPRTRWRRNEYALRSDGCEPGHHADCCNGHRQAQAQRRRNECDARRRPMSGDEDHGAVAMFVVGLDPCVTRLGGRGPAACGPHPAALPRPIATGPDRALKWQGRRYLHQHRWRRPRHGNRRRLVQRRIDIHADHRRGNGYCRRGLNGDIAHRLWLDDAACGQERQGHARELGDGT
ncbi:hypothetical protein SAMN03159363_2690 [Variovorax sp. EL159]|nr:hypothetical protein SAMN03159363_2690 [Variovorax sp. EL159]